MISKLICLIFTLVISFQYAFTQEKFYTCINEKGERMFSIKVSTVYAYSDGMAQVSQSVLDGQKSFYRWGYLDEKGNLAIPCQYERATDFAFGVAWVMEPGSNMYYLINKKGERLSDQTWGQVGYFLEGFCSVFDSEGKMGFVNRKGELIVPCKYTGDAFNEGLACVMPYEGTTANYGFIDTTGAVVIPFQFNQAGTSSFQHGECRVQINGITCLINKKGEVIFKPTLTKNCMGFCNGLSASYTNTSNRTGWGYYNRNNVWVIKPQFDNGTDFENGLAIVEKAGKYGVIDTLGNFIIPMEYASIFGSGNTGFFGCEKEENGDKLYFNIKGESFAKIPVKYVVDANGSPYFPYTSPEGLGGFLNADGTVFIEARYKQVSAFSEGKSWIKENITDLPIAAGFSEQNFAKEYQVGDKTTCQKNKSGQYLPVTIEQVTEHYYLVKYSDGNTAWVVYNQLKR